MSRGLLRGRDTEIGRLDRMLRTVVESGAAAVALISGEPGIGKTAMLDEILVRGRDIGYTVGRGKAEELDQIAPLASLLAAMLFGPRPLLTAEQFAALSSLQEQRFWLVEKLAAALEARASDTPVLVAVDDVQWADPLSRFALRVLPARLRGSPVCWLLTSRDESAGAADEIVSAVGHSVLVERVELAPLSGAAIGELAHDVLGPSVDDRVRTLLDGAGGNPFLAVEMLEGLAAAASSRSEAGGDAPPARLVLGVRGRLSSLSPGALRLLQVGAVLGRRFTLTDVAALLGEAATALLPDLDAAVRGAVLHDDGDAITFRHDLLRQAVYADIPPSARKALHRACASNFMANGRRPIDAAHHVLIGAAPGDAQAVDLLRRAANDVLWAVPGLAADLVARALALTEPTDPARFDVGEEAIAFLTVAHRNQAAVEVGDGLLALDPPPETRGRIEASLGRALWNLGLVTQMRQRAEAAIAIAGLRRETRARLAASRAFALARSPDLETARTVGMSALHEAIEIGDQRSHVTALWALGETSLNGGHCETALGHYAALCAIDPAAVTGEIAARQYLDDFDGAGRLLADARRATERSGGRVQLTDVMWVQANQNLGLGQLDDAETDFRTLVRLETDLQQHTFRVSCQVALCWIAWLRGDEDLARECVAAAQADLSLRPDPGNMAALGFLQAWTADVDGDAARAAAILRKDRFDPLLMMRWKILRPWIVTGVRIALRGNDPDLARELAAAAAEYARRNPSVPTAVGLAAQAGGVASADLDMLKHAVEVLRTGPRPLVCADAAVDYGIALLRRGRRRDGASALNDAWETYRTLGATGAAHRVERLMHTGSSRSRRPTAPTRPTRGWGALTATERRVGELIAAGHTNRSAAAELSISPHTVNTHLGAVFRKLEVTSRVQLTRAVLGADAV